MTAIRSTATPGPSLSSVAAVAQVAWAAVGVEHGGVDRAQDRPREAADAVPGMPADVPRRAFARPPLAVPPVEALRALAQRVEARDRVDEMRLAGLTGVL